MKLERISRIRGHRIFRDLTWSNSLEEFAQFNLIYGWNGTGKTTLSGLFSHLERQVPITEGQVDFIFDGVKVSGASLATATIPQVRVFNRATVARSVFESSSPQLPPVFVFGEESAEKQRKLDELKAQVPEIDSAVSSAAGKVAATSSSLNDYAADKARAIKNLLTTPGGGSFNNYNAGDFKTYIRALQQKVQEGAAQVALTTTERDALIALKDSRPLAALPPLTVTFPDVLGLHKRATEALAKTVVSEVIGNLAEQPALADWVSTGLHLHTHDGDATHCKFCEQLLPAERLRKLEAHFNDEFKRFNQDLDNLASAIEVAASGLRGVSFPRKEDLYPELQADYARDQAILKMHLNNVASGLDSLKRALRLKQEHLFESLDLNSVLTGGDGRSDADKTIWATFMQAIVGGAPALSEYLGRNALTTVIKHTESHNAKTRDFQTQVQQAREKLHQHELVEALPGWLSRQSAANAAQDEEAEARGKKTDLTTRITALEADILEHRPPADELNKELADYLGHTEIQLAVEQTGYRLIRRGQPAGNLSEGERTAIAFLYFLKSLQDRSFDIGNGIVVIDDPISSLDSNSLYSAFGFMKQRVAKPGQLFVLTHNFTFLRLVRNWFGFLNGRKKPAQCPARFYMLKAQSDGGERSSEIFPLDPFLRDYESEYHYIFKRVMEEAAKPAGQPLEKYYEAPNLARRLLESFLAFKVPDAGSLHARLEQVDFDGHKKIRILRFLDTHSHADQIAEGHDDASGLSEAPAVLQNLLELLESCDKAHYERMNRAIQRAT